jgi:hypothetical protein
LALEADAKARDKEAIMTEPFLPQNFSEVIWEMLSPEERVITLLFFEAGTEGLKPEEVKSRFSKVWPMENDRIEAWRKTAVWGGAMTGH